MNVFSFPTLLPEQVGWGWARSWEGTQWGQLTQIGKHDILYHAMLCSGVKVEGRWRKVCVWGWCLSSKVAVAETLDEDLPAWGRQWVTGCLTACLGQPTTVGWILELVEFYLGCSKYKSFVTGSAVYNLFLKDWWGSNFKRFWTIENVLYYDHVSLFWESNLALHWQGHWHWRYPAFSEVPLAANSHLIYKTLFSARVHECCTVIYIFVLHTCKMHRVFCLLLISLGHPQNNHGKTSAESRRIILSSRNLVKGRENQNICNWWKQSKARYAKRLKKWSTRKCSPCSKTKGYVYNTVPLFQINQIGQVFHKEK